MDEDNKNCTFFTSGANPAYEDYMEAELVARDSIKQGYCTQHVYKLVSTVQLADTSIEVVKE